MTRRRICLWSSALTIFLLVAGAIGLSDGTQDSAASITASPDVKLHEPEPVITADSSAKTPAQPKPKVDTEHTNPIIPVGPSLSTPYNIPPSLIAPPNPPSVVPLPAPQHPPVAPIVPPQVQPLPPVVIGPLDSLVGPLIPPAIKPLVPPILK